MAANRPYGKFYDFLKCQSGMFWVPTHKLMIQVIVMQLVHFSSYDIADNLIALLGGYSSADQNMINGDWDKTLHFTPVRKHWRHWMGGR
jgi:hypothetical protein